MNNSVPEGPILHTNVLSLVDNMIDRSNSRVRDTVTAICFFLIFEKNVWLKAGVAIPEMSITSVIMVQIFALISTDNQNVLRSSASRLSSKLLRRNSRKKSFNYRDTNFMINCR